jgi:hypothetical protein
MTLLLFPELRTNIVDIDTHWLFENGDDGDVESQKRRIQTESCMSFIISNIFWGRDNKQKCDICRIYAFQSD